MSSMMEAAAKETGKVSNRVTVCFKPNESYRKFLGKNGLEPKLVNYMTWAMLAAADVATDFPPVDSVKLPEQSDINKVVSDAYKSQCHSAAKKWVMQLVACEQVRTLNDRNFESYFQSMDSQIVPYKINEVISFLASRFPPITKMEGWRELLCTSSFVEYHTTACTTPALCVRADECLSFSIYSENEMAAIRAACEDMTNMSLARNIPNKALVLAYAALDASSLLPSKWYMGQKAKDMFPPATYVKYMRLFKKAISLDNDVDSIEKAKGIEEITALFKAMNQE